jgi:hypothetical protein
VLLIPDWTICRISGETGINLDAAEKRRYGTCLIVVLKPSALESIEFPVRAHRGDALCFIDEDLEQYRTLGGRQIKQDDIDFPAIHQWLSSCDTQHGSACKPLFTPDLENIHLVDVDTREIVRHPAHETDYVALSYVWGEVKQQSFKVGDRLKMLPQTLEDSIVFTKSLGKRYLWADSLCIDQSDDNEKEDQIQRMRDIYHGAYVTIIAISGESANAGLPRVGPSKVHQQLSCCIDGKRLVGLMPTLSQQVWLSPWGQRAWTFQESRLSPRCLLLSNHQLYFECKGFQCIESLEARRSWVHNLSIQSNTTTENFASWMIAQGGSGCFRHSVDTRELRISSYGYALNLYSARKVRYAEDRVKAFAGILQSLDTVYPRGFIEGLPIEDLNWGLLWRSRYPSPRRAEFPSWSWAGWDGAVWFGQPIDHTRPCRCPIYLDIQNIKYGRLQRLFHTNTESADPEAGVSIIIRNDPVDKMRLCPGTESTLCIDSMPRIEQDRALFIDGTCFSFKLDFSQPRHQRSGSGLPGSFAFPVRKITCGLRIMSTDNEISRTQDVEKDFILLARDYYDKFIVHYLLLFYYGVDNPVAMRGTVLDLFVPMEHLDILEDLKPRREQVVLI